jgi:hypothetical protein
MPALRELIKNGFRNIPRTTAWADLIDSVVYLWAIFALVILLQLGAVGVVAFVPLLALSAVLTTLRARRWDDSARREPVIPFKALLVAPLSALVLVIGSAVVDVGDNQWVLALSLSPTSRWRRSRHG